MIDYFYNESFFIQLVIIDYFYDESFFSIQVVIIGYFYNESFFSVQVVIIGYFYNESFFFYLYSSAYHMVRPSKAPGFAYAWLELISHRVFVSKLLLQTPQQKVLC